MAKFFIVEDEALIIEELKITLDKLGHKVLGGQMKGNRVIEHIKNISPDMVLLDINIKGPIDGIEVGKKIKEQLQIPFIFITALSDQKTLERAKQTMPYGYIVKPFSEKSLNASIEMALFKFNSETEKTTPNKAAIEKQFKISLSEKEYKILICFFNGNTYKETADQNLISINTVKTYQKKLYQLLDVDSKVALIQKLNNY